MYDALPKNEKTFELDLVGQTTGLPYSGEFTVKCVLDMAGRHAEELEKTRLLADYANPSDGLYGIAMTLSKVRARIMDGPKWWKDSKNGASIRDENVVIYLHDQCDIAEVEWQDKIKKEAEKVQENPPKESK